jgi:hypothetical protein
MKLPNDYRQQAARILGVPPGNVSRRAAETVFVGNRLNRLNWTPPEIDRPRRMQGILPQRLNSKSVVWSLKIRTAKRALKVDDCRYPAPERHPR